MPSFCRTLPDKIEGGSNKFEAIEPCDLKLLAKVIRKYMWSPGVFRDSHRCNANFLYSDFIGLDVDNDPEDAFYSLEDAINDWQDSECIIALTRNHMKPKLKKNRELPAVPRFRIITRWERRITDAETFTYTVQRFLNANSQYDSICKDAARMFYPCSQLVFENYDGYRQEVRQLPPKTPMISTIDGAVRQYIVKPRLIEKHVQDFLNQGKIFGGGRNIAVYITTLSLLRANVDPEKVLDAIEQSPFDRCDFSHYELLRTYNNGLTAFLGEKKSAKCP